MLCRVISETVGTAGNTIVNVIKEIFLKGRSFRVDVRKSSHLMRGAGKSVAEIIKGRSALLVIKGFKTSAAGLNKIFAYLIGCGSSVVCNYIYNNLYTILMGLIAHCLKFITSTELIITDFEISRLIVIVPLSVAVKIHTAVFALKTLVNRRCLHSRKTCCGNIPH